MSLFTAPASAAVKHRRELRERKRNTQTEAVIMMQQHVELSNIFIVTIVFSMKRYDKYFSSVSENLTKVIIIMLTPERDCVA